MKKEDIDKILNILGKTNVSKHLDDTIKSLETKCKGEYKKKAVLGIDIYRYSKYDLFPQSLIPYWVF